MRRKFSFFHISLLCIAIAFTACTKSSSDDDKNEGDDREFTTDCGLVFRGRLENPIAADQGTPVTIQQIIGVDIATVTNDNNGDEMLVRFHGIAAGDIPATKQFEGRLMLEEFGRQAIFYKANDDCETEFGNEQAVIGQLLTRNNGTSFNEELLNGGYARADDGASVCSAEFLQTCYQALEEDNVPQQQPDFEFDDDDNSFTDDNNDGLDDLFDILSGGGGGGISRTDLWKHSSESTGNVVVLLANGTSSPSDQMRAERRDGSFVNFNARQTECSHNGGRCHFWSPLACGHFKGGGAIQLKRAGSNRYQTIWRIPGNPCSRNERNR